MAGGTWLPRSWIVPWPRPTSLERLAWEAIAIVEQTDWLEQRGRVLEDIGAVPLTSARPAVLRGVDPGSRALRA
jgi:hypothetical protein